MIRATAVSVIDQALLSALSFGLAFALIHLATKEQYGLYAQLVNLQSFFSPVHAGVFVSAFLAVSTRMDSKHRPAYRASITRAEVVCGILSALAVTGICLLGASRFDSSIRTDTCVAFGVSLLGLWWREYARTLQFAELKVTAALRIDVAYCLITATTIVFAAVSSRLTLESVFWCMAVAALAAAARPLSSAFGEANVPVPVIWKDLVTSWRVGRWDVLGSVVTWGYQQSYVYFAAAHGGLSAAAEVSAGRLLATPLSLTWASYANVLRPKASQLLSAGAIPELRRLVRLSSAFVVVSSAAYAALALVAMPVIVRILFAGKFEHLPGLTICWVLYSALAGITTVASSVLRSAMQFRGVFARQVICCAAAVLFLTLATRFEPIESLVIALIAVEAISVALLWHRVMSLCPP